MVKSTIDEIKDITLERQIRKLAGVIDEQNKKIEQSIDYSTDIDNLKASDANQTIQINNLKQTVATDKLATESAITALQNKDTEQDGTLTEHTTLIQDITESLVSNVQIMSGTTTGEIKVRLERESAKAIDSNNYNLGLPVSAEIIQGTGPSMFKIQITMSSGVKVVSNDFVFTTEAIGTDVYISSFTFKAGNQTGYLSADIGLNNGVVIEANNFLVPTDPNVTSAITDLQTRMTNVENSAVSDARISAIETKNTEQDTKISELETKNTQQDTKISELETKNTQQDTKISELETKNTEQDTAINGKVAIAQGTENAGKVLGVGVDGNVTPVEGSSGGEVWEEVDFNNWPTDWVVGDRIKVIISANLSVPSAPTSWTNGIGSCRITASNTSRSNVIEFELQSSSNYPGIAIYIAGGSSKYYVGCLTINNYPYVDFFNSGSTLLVLAGKCWNGSNLVMAENLYITPTQNVECIKKMWRLKKA